MYWTFSYSQKCFFGLAKIKLWNPSIRKEIVIILQKAFSNKINEYIKFIFVELYVRNILKKIFDRLKSKKISKNEYSNNIKIVRFNVTI